MLKDPLGWFPNGLFSNLLAVLFFGSYLIDSLAPRLTGAGRGAQPARQEDRFSFLAIRIAGLLAVVAALAGRYFNWLVLPGWAQWLGLVTGFAGIVFREWAVITLGRFFSRVVEIEAGHRLVTGGPYRWFRHPAYTGMLLVYTGIALALGSGAGVLAAVLLVGSATLYRIRVEEAVMRRAFGEQYEAYARGRWRLFPGW